MGYDMYLIGEPAEADVKANVKKVAKFERLMKAVTDLGWGNSDEIPVVLTDEQREKYFEIMKDEPWEVAQAIAVGAPSEAVDALRIAIANKPADLTYFRLNIWGMGKYAQLMSVAGMLTESKENPWLWPRCEQFDITEDEWYAFEEDGGDEAGLSPETIVKCEKFQDANNEHRRTHGATPGIPGHKFGSNDGWVVTSEECAQARAQFARFLGSSAADVDRAITEYGKLGEDERKELVRPILVARYPNDPQEALDEVLSGFAEGYFIEWLGFLGRGERNGNGFEVW